MKQNNNRKSQNISVAKTYIFILIMGTIGAVVGAIDNMESRESSSEEVIVQMGIGACGGMVAASFLSIPTIFSKKNSK
ncbi:hypothetical protein [Myxosarcina sp. GI1]|uniref:hypothetical protein n=1 Tax=Myxosarcina sp. GI1 TaxID=1541065 RepID=UPI0005624858|nr:hypothetical protein [Myxosarcina sp. GI1]